MSATNPQQQRERLADAYGRMADGEIEKLAREAWKLTDLAREVLRAEIARRGLALDLAEAPREPTYSELVTIRRYRDVWEAVLAQSVLESAEIECFLADDIVVRMDWYWSNAIGGVRVRVADEDVADSIAILDSNRNPSESFAIGHVGEFVQPRCPSCNSLDISPRLTPSAYTYKFMSIFMLGCAAMVMPPFFLQRQPSEMPFAFGITIVYGALILPTVFPIRPALWICGFCGRRWDEGNQPPPAPPQSIP